MSIKLQEEYGDSVNVLLVETGKLSDVETEQFVIKKKWKGGKSIWTRERPFDIGLNYLPAAVLVSADGKVVLKGNPIELHPKIKSEIDAELAAAKKPPKDVPDAVGKAIVDFNGGNYARALATLKAIVDKPPAKDPTGLVPASQKAMDELKARIDARFVRVQTQMDQGLYAAALAQLTDLGKGLKGNDDLMKRQAEALAKLNADDLKTERDAADALARLEKKLDDKGPDNDLAKEFEALSKKYAGTKAAARADALAEVAKEEKGKKAG